MALIPPVPMSSPIFDKTTHWFTRDIVRFLDTLRSVMSAAAQVIASVSLTSQSATIATTDVPTSPLTEGLYRVTYSLRITQAATTSSSAQLTLGWTSNSVSSSQTFAAVTGNTTATQQSDTITVFSDAGTPITYAVVYASVGATPMLYSFNVLIEDL